MKFIIVAAAIALAVTAQTRTLAEEMLMFQDFKATYGRQYSHELDVHRFKCFSTNLKLIDARNALGGEVHGVNQFADLCQEEFSKMYLGFKGNHTKPATRQVTPKALAAGAKVDWRMKGAVTPIKNQGQCGSCWSFSATGNMEGQWFLAGNTLTSFSEEELVQCSHNGNEGCNGGLMDWAFEWVTSNGGITTEANYPYTSGGGVTGTCQSSKLASKVGVFTGHTDIAHNEATMATWVMASGPLAIGVDASSWSSYTGGIMKNCFGTQLDHGVLIVGYDTTNSPPYWIVKNSWGTSWGENGFLRIEYGKNQCGITMAPSSSIAKKSA